MSSWIPKARPTIGRKATIEPTHLRAVTDAFERIALGEQVFMVVNVPRQHGKTTVCEAGFVWLLKRIAGLRAVFATYSDRRAWRESARMRQNLVRPAGLELRRASGDVWECRNGSSAVFSGVNGGGVIGEPADFALIDDTIPNRKSAESVVEREARWEWLSAVLFPAVQDTGSVVLVETRWHVDDTTGRIMEQARKREGFPWEFVRLPAINALGQPLAPAIRALPWLERLRDGGMTPYDWSSLMQQQPVPRGAQRFGPAHRYAPEELNPAVRAQLTVCIGLDLAYTAKTSSDWSVAYVLGVTPDGERIYVLDRVKARKSAEDFVDHDLVPLRDRYPAARWRWYGYGPELAAAGYIRRRGIPLTMESRPGDKFVRALPAMGAHRTGRLLWPAAAPWLADALRVVGRFTGVGDKEDDDVDALAAAVDEALVAGRPRSLGAHVYDRAPEHDLALPGLPE